MKQESKQFKQDGNIRYSVGKSYFGIENNYVGVFPPSYAVIPLFISSFTTFHYLDPYTSLGLNRDQIGHRICKVKIDGLVGVMLRSYVYYLCTVDVLCYGNTQSLDTTNILLGL